RGPVCGPVHLPNTDQPSPRNDRQTIIRPCLTLPDQALREPRNEGVPGSSPGVGFDKSPAQLLVSLSLEATHRPLPGRLTRDVGYSCSTRAKAPPCPVAIASGISCPGAVR